MQHLSSATAGLTNANALASAGGVMSALRMAASETGTDFGYLLKTAMRESSLNPTAKAGSSSATGLFQFIEQTWLGTVREHGAEHGLKTYADAIEVGSNGRFQVADGALRREILALRKDPETAALMAGEMTSQTQGDMESALGRHVSAGELYIAHFMGPKAAIKLITAAGETPNASAAEMFPQAASANRSIFYGAGGVPRSVASVATALMRKHDGLPGDSDAMLAAADQPARGMPWRGTVEDGTLPTPPAWSNAAFMRDDALVMAPLMVQLLASLDDLPNAAALFGSEASESRRTSDDTI